jgi:multidrug efflux system membrane fusion protein
MKLKGFFATRPWLMALLIGVAVVLWMASGQTGGKRPSPQADARSQAVTSTVPEVQVRTQAAEWVTRYVTLYGRTAPARAVDLKSETRGRVVAFGVRRGAQVDAGTVLISLDERDRRARLAEARAILVQRETEYEAQKKLKFDGYVSDTLLAEGAARLESARADLRRAELDLEYMTIEAPFDGALQERMVEIGDYVDTGDPVARFIDNRRLVVTASVAEGDVEAVRSQTHGQARLITGQHVEGKIRYVAPVAEAATRTFIVELDLDNSEGVLPAGVTAELTIPAGEVLAQRVSPALLTLDDEGTLGLKTVDPTGRGDFHPANVIKSSSDGVWIAGLPEEATIITVGQGFVRAGENVNAIHESLDDDVMTAESPK